MILIELVLSNINKTKDRLPMLGQFVKTKLVEHINADTSEYQVKRDSEHILFRMNRKNYLAVDGFIPDGYLKTISTSVGKGIIISDFDIKKDVVAYLSKSEVIKHNINDMNVSRALDVAAKPDNINVQAVAKNARRLTGLTADFDISENLTTLVNVIYYDETTASGDTHSGPKVFKNYAVVPY
jgi:hypothetical protein